MRDKLLTLLSPMLAVAGLTPTWTTAGVLALLGLAGGATAGLVARWLSPILLGVSILLLGRSFYILYIHRRGTRASTVITWFSAAAVIGYWTWRLA